MQNVLVTGPSVEPVTTDEAKDFLRITTDDDNTIIDTLITAARTFFEEKTQLALINQTWKLTFDRIPNDGSNEPWWDGVQQGSISVLNKPCRYIELPKTPLSSVTSFTAYDASDTGTDFTDFLTDTGRMPGRVALRSGSTWPTATRGVANYEIVYVAGYGAAASSLPVDIKIAIRQIIAHWYENRELVNTTGGVSVPMGVQNIINTRRIRNL